MIQGKSGAIYTGISTDPCRRLDEHNRSKRGAKWARKERPLKLIYYQVVGTKSEALKIEAVVKKLTHAHKINLAATFIEALAITKAEINNDCEATLI